MQHIAHNHCRNCGDDVPIARWSLGFKFCMPCGEKLARQKKHTLVPMHKSNYMMITNMEDLKGINNKGGLHH